MTAEQDKYVRITGIKNKKFVEFDFAINNPEFYVELVLPFDMFDTFCKNNHVTFLELNEDAADDVEKLNWRLSRVKSG